LLNREKKSPETARYRLTSLPHKNSACFSKSSYCEAPYPKCNYSAELAFNDLPAIFFA
jgi:hypothetical protein